MDPNAGVTQQLSCALCATVKSYKCKIRKISEKNVRLLYVHFLKYFAIFIFFGGIKIPSVQKAVRGRGGRVVSSHGRGRSTRSRRASPEKSSTTSTVDTLEDEEPLGSTPQVDEDVDNTTPPLPQSDVSRPKQTAKCGRPFGNLSRSPLEVRKCSVNIQRQDEENVKPKIIEKVKKQGSKQTSKKGIKKEQNKKAGKKIENTKKPKKDKPEIPEKDTQNENNTEVQKEDEKNKEKTPPKQQVTEKKDKPEIPKKDTQNENNTEVQKEDEKNKEKTPPKLLVTEKKEKPEIPKNDMQNEDKTTKQDESVKRKPKAAVAKTPGKSYHIETAFVMDTDSAENIRKDSMEVLGDSLKIKTLEDQIEDMLTTRTQVKDTQQRIAVLESILRSLQKEALADEEKEKREKKYVKSQGEKDSEEKEEEVTKTDTNDDKGSKPEIKTDGEDNEKQNTPEPKPDSTEDEENKESKKDSEEEEKEVTKTDTNNDKGSKPEIKTDGEDNEKQNTPEPKTNSKEEEMPAISQDKPKSPNVTQPEEEIPKTEEIRKDEAKNEDTHEGNGFVIDGKIGDSKKADEIRKSVHFNLEDDESDLKDGVIQVEVEKAMTTLALVVDNAGNVHGEIDEAYIHFPSSQKDIGKYSPQTEDISDDDDQMDKIRKIDMSKDEILIEGKNEENVTEIDREAYESDIKGEDMVSIEDTDKCAEVEGVKDKVPDEKSKENEIRKFENDREEQMLECEQKYESEKKKDEDGEVIEKDDQIDENTDDMGDAKEDKSGEDSQKDVNAETKPDEEKCTSETNKEKDKENKMKQTDEHKEEEPTFVER